MVLAYHFVGATLRDGRPVPPDGEWLVHDGPLVLCESGLHASRHPFDALQYAPGPTLCLVECGGEVIDSYNKLVCRRRRIVRRIDATDRLRGFARHCARDVLHRWDAPEIVRRYLDTGDESMRAAARAAARAATRAAAMAAAMAVGWDAARAAARAATRAATGAAAGAAAWDAARAATRAAAMAVGWDAARAAQRARFAAIVHEAFR